MCTGNICRSPFIERLLQHHLDDCQPDLGRPGADRHILVHSAGTSGLTGWAMDERAAAHLVAHGGDPAGFRAREVTPALIAESDLVLTATRAHRGKVAAMDHKALRKVFTFRDFADLVNGLDGLSSGVGSMDPLGWDPGGRVRQLTEQAASSRGLKPPLAPEDADILDPYGRDDEMFAVMAQQIVESMPAVVRALSG